jgi:tripartite-type tricarboxylate transporter receptor subunit TctC
MPTPTTWSAAIRAERACPPPRPLTAPETDMTAQCSLLARRALLALPLICAAGALAQPAAGVVRFVVPFPAGGVTDQVARIVAEAMARPLGQTLIVDNRPGAGGRIGIDAVLKAPADGSVWLFTNSSYGILPVIDPKVAFDPTRDLVPVSMIGSYGLQIVTRKDMPAASLSAFIAHARQNPGKLSYGSAGMGSGAHFAGEYFKSLTGTYLVHIPYKSTSAALADVAGGLLDLTFDAAAKPLIDAGRVKLLAVTGDKRDPRFPNTPTAQEAGLPPFAAMQSWLGLLAPAGTPAAMVERFNAAASAAVAEPGVQRRLADLGVLAQGGPASRLGNAIGEDLRLYRDIASQARLRFD